MRWGRILVLVVTGLVGLGVGLFVAEPWGGGRSVDAIELDEAWREDDAGEAGMPDVDDDDGTGNGARTGGGATDDGRDGTRDGDTHNGKNTGTAGGGTDDGRDGTRDGDTRVGGGGTGTGDSAVGAGGAFDAATDDGGAAGGTDHGGGSADSASGGGDT